MKKKTVLRLLWRIPLGALLLLTMLLLLSSCFVDRIIFQPPEPQPPAAEQIELEVAPGSTIALRYLPPPTPEAFTLLYSHGNAELIALLEPLFQTYALHGYGVAAYDYEGYGQSSGKPSEANAIRDIERVYRYLTEEIGTPPERIVIVGFSVGSGPSCYLAEQQDAAALVLQAPFISTFSVVGMGWMPGNRFRNIDRIPNIDMPLLIFHGNRDGIIPFYHGKHLFEAAKEPKDFFTVRGAGHNNILYFAGNEYWNTLHQFLEQHKRPLPQAENSK